MPDRACQHQRMWRDLETCPKLSDDARYAAKAFAPFNPGPSLRFAMAALIGIVPGAAAIYLVTQATTVPVAFGAAVMATGCWLMGYKSLVKGDPGIVREIALMYPELIQCVERFPHPDLGDTCVVTLWGGAQRVVAIGAKEAGELFDYLTDRMASVGMSGVRIDGTPPRWFGGITNQVPGTAPVSAVA